jgi:hypothetical protein
LDSKREKKTRKSELPLHPGFIVIPVAVTLVFRVMLPTMSFNSDMTLTAEEELYGLLWLVGTLIDLSYIVVQLIFLHGLWKIAQASDLNVKKPTPGKAVWLSVIPFFGLYWGFIMWRNLALHLNHLSAGRKIPVLLPVIGLSISYKMYLVGLGVMGAAELYASLGFMVGGAILAPVGVTLLLISNFYFYNTAKDCLSNRPATTHGNSI